MARFIPRICTSDGKTEISMEEFKKFLKNFDTNGDGRIDVGELGEAIWAHGGRFCTWKAKRVMKEVDSNGNGAIDDDEVGKLAVFALKRFGYKIVNL